MLEHSKNTSNCLVVILVILEVKAEDILDLLTFYHFDSDRNTEIPWSSWLPFESSVFFCLFLLLLLDFDLFSDFDEYLTFGSPKEGGNHVLFPEKSSNTGMNIWWHN